MTMPSAAARPVQRTVKEMKPRFALAILFVALFAAAGAAIYLSLFDGRQAAKNIAAQLRDEVSVRVRERVKAYMAVPHLLNRLNASAIAAGLLEPENIQNRNRHFREMLQAFPAIDSSYFDTAHGVRFGAERHSGGGLRFFDASASGPWDKAGQKTAVQAGKAVWSDIIPSSKGAVIVAVLPVYGKKGEGILGSSFLLSRINEFLGSLAISRSGLVFILDRSGRLAASSGLPAAAAENGQKQRIQADAGNTSAFLANVIRTAKNEKAEDQSADDRLGPADRQYELTLDGKRLFLQTVPLRDPYGLDWLLAVAVPETKLSVRANALTAVLLCLLLPAVLIFWHIRREGAAANEEKQDALARVRQELVQSEKMASLGRLIAGVAHEINTPLGAIRSSADSINRFLKHTLTQLPEFFHSLPRTQQECFLMMLRCALEKNVTLSTREERKLKKALCCKLEEMEIPYSDIVADNLADMGLCEDVAPFFQLLQGPENVQTLQMVCRLSELYRNVQTIEIATDRASKTVLALRNFARYDHSGKKTDADIAAGIETVLTLYHNLLKQGISVIKNYAELPLVPCYPDELNQVWTNLIHNALHAMDNKGTLTIDTGVRDAWIYVDISDDGKGIPEEIRDKIFEPFFTTKPAGEGSGLGLDIVRKIIEKHSGKITVQSAAGKGSVFSVSLPAAPEESL
ncbi:MAG: hypothetical protein GY862_18415 [Gammaproteobacteria bacterium]|nr:hypothetical protein [Gammaproteobacteria bacterium]